MDHSTPVYSAPSHPDFAAFEAGVRARLPQRRQLPATAAQGIERLGRLVHRLRTRQHWSLETLAAKTSLSWLWLALLEHGMLLPAEVTETSLRQLARAFPPQRNAPSPDVLFLTLAEDLLRLRLPRTEAVEAHEASASGVSLPPEEAPQQAKPWQAAVQEFGDRLVRWISLPWQPTWAGEMVTAADVSAQEQVFYLEDGNIQVTCEWRAAYRNLPATLRVTWQAQLSIPGDFWVRFTHPNDPTRSPVEFRLGHSLAGEEEFTAETLGFDPTRDPWALAILLKASEP